MRGEEEGHRKAGGGTKKEKNKATSVDGKCGEYLPGDCNLHLSVGFFFFSPILPT